MPTQKTFKSRVRARMTKTGESYTAARHQLLRKAGATLPDAMPADLPDLEAGAAATDAVGEAGAAHTSGPTSDRGAGERSTSDAAIRRATGRGHDEWFGMLDEWGAGERPHPEIARWLQETHGVGSWWAQSITVDYERATGRRARHQIDGAYAVSATRTIGAEPSRLLAAFTDEALRAAWLPSASMTQRATRAARTARFDWTEPPSRVVVTVTEKGAGRVTVAVQHEQLPDPATAERLKAMWRERLGALKAVLERG